MDRVTRCLHCGKRMVPDAQLQRTHRVKVRVLRQAGPDGGAGGKTVGRQSTSRANLPRENRLRVIARSRARSETTLLAQ